MSNTPTDAEIRGLAAEGNGVYQDDETAVWEITDPSLIKFARAVLAKWGTPQPVVREPLTDGQAKEVLWTEHLRWMEAAGLDTEGMRPTGEWLDHWLAYVRAIEQANDITGRQKNG